MTCGPQNTVAQGRVSKKRHPHMPMRPHDIWNTAQPRSPFDITDTTAMPTNTYTKPNCRLGEKCRSAACLLDHPSGIKPNHQWEAVAQSGAPPNPMPAEATPCALSGGAKCLRHHFRKASCALGPWPQRQTCTLGPSHTLSGTSRGSHSNQTLLYVPPCGKTLKVYSGLGSKWVLVFIFLGFTSKNFTPVTVRELWLFPVRGLHFSSLVAEMHGRVRGSASKRGRGLKASSESKMKQSHSVRNAMSLSLSNNVTLTGQQRDFHA